MTSPFRYHAFGLDFQSEIELPEMRAGHAGVGKPISICLAPAPCPEGLTAIVDGVAAGPQDFWMDVPGAASINVTGGSKIAIDPAPQAVADDIRAYLLGSAIGALLYQRGYLLLHASAVEIDGIAVAFCGTSGAGKSSIAHALVNRGHRLICDDIAAIVATECSPMVWPGLISLKLWGDRLAAVGVGPEGLRPVLAKMDKYLRPVAALAPFIPHELSHIVKLSVADDQQITVAPLTGSSGAALLVANSFRGQLIGPMQHEEAHFLQCARLANAAHLWALARPWSHQGMTATCVAVENAIKTS